MLQKLIFPLAIAAIIVIFTGCSLNDRQISKLWFYTYSSSSNAGKTTSLSPVSFLYLQPDGIYTCDFGKFDYGTWKRENRTLKLYSYEKKNITIPINYVSDKEIKFGNSNDAIENFEASPAVFKNEANDPFSKDNNLWRIAATHKETDAEIKHRLLNHLKYWELYFTWALDNSLANIDVRSTPTLIKIYGNGFSLKPVEKLPKAWKSYFFDEEDCLKANKQIEYILENEQIGWVHTDNKYKMFISAFQQLQQNMRK